MSRKASNSNETESRITRRRIPADTKETDEPLYSENDPGSTNRSKSSSPMKTKATLTVQEQREKAKKWAMEDMSKKKNIISNISDEIKSTPRKALATKAQTPSKDKAMSTRASTRQKSPIRTSVEDEEEVAETDKIQEESLITSSVRKSSRSRKSTVTDKTLAATTTTQEEKKESSVDKSKVVSERPAGDSETEESKATSNANVLLKSESNIATSEDRVESYESQSVHPVITLILTISISGYLYTKNEKLSVLLLVLAIIIVGAKRMMSE